MNLEVDVRNVDGVNRFVRSVFDDQLPFATSVAINKTALAFQVRQRARLREIFTIRRKSFADRSIKIKPFSRKTTLEARVSVDSPQGRSDIFGKFETETSKTPFRGNSVAVPTRHVERTPTGVIRKGWRPKEILEDAEQHGSGRVIKSKGNVFRGNKRAFLIRRPGGKGVIRRPGGKGVILQRTGPGKSDLRPLYQLVPRVKIEPDLEFVETAQKTVQDVFDDNFRKAFDHAIRTAR